MSSFGKSFTAIRTDLETHIASLKDDRKHHLSAFPGLLKSFHYDLRSLKVEVDQALRNDFKAKRPSDFTTRRRWSKNFFAKLCTRFMELDYVELLGFSKSSFKADFEPLVNEEDACKSNVKTFIENISEKSNGTDVSTF